MRRNLIKIIAVILIPLVDVLLTTLLLTHGYHWRLFSISIAQYSFTSSSFDLWCFTLLRFNIIWGGVVGVMRNRQEGPKNCHKWSWIVKTITCINFYYVCAKLLALSDKPSFVAGTQFYWFLALFVWSLFGSALCICLWQILSSLKFTVDDIVLVDEDSLEQQCLLKDNQHKQFGIVFV